MVAGVVRLVGEVFVRAGSGRDRRCVHRRRSRLPQNHEAAGRADAIDSRTSGTRCQAH